MHITPSLIYWISRLDNIGVFCILSGLIAILALIAALFYWLSGETPDEDTPLLSRIIKILIAYIVCAFTLSIFLPSTKEAAAIIVIPQVANSETVSNLKDLNVELIDLAHVWAKELKPSK